MKKQIKKLNYNQMLIKIANVFESCETEQQIESAMRYAKCFQDFYDRYYNTRNTFLENRLGMISAIASIEREEAYKRIEIMGF